MSKLRSMVLHPLLFAAYPALALFASNLNDVSLQEAARSLVVCLVGAGLLWGLLRLILKDALKAGLLTTLLLALFFAYGHVYDLVKGWAPLGVPVGRHRYLLPVWVALGAAGAWRLLRTRRAPQVSALFNWVALFSLLIPFYTLVAYSVFPASPAPLPSDLADMNRQASAGEAPPDIYYIILDGYGRADVLRDLYDFDNSDLIAFLEARGFYVAQESHSNYGRTRNSLASSLNMTYVNYLGEEVNVATSPAPLGPLKEMIEHSAVRGFLEARGYQTVSFATGYKNTELRDADRYVYADRQANPGLALNSGLAVFGRRLEFNKFETLLLDTTLLRPLVDVGAFARGPLQEAVIGPEYRAHRDRILSAFAHLADYADEEGQHFVFAHVLAPHPPFVFGPQGEALDYPWPYSLQDGSGYRGTRQGYLSGYRDQVIYVNKLLEAAITEILAKSERPPVIVIQGDHGPGAYVDWDAPQNSYMPERLSILNAYYFPDGDYSLLYPSITPVNTFRVVFKKYFGADLDLIEDRSYFLVGSYYDFLDVSDRLAGD